MLLLAMLDNHANTPLKYCLYARKSSESDEKQAMSIGSQLVEMRDLAAREGLDVVTELQESHSAKDSGQRPVYSAMLDGIRNEEYNAILTWAPDRLSRNAGDLGSVVDLMDQKKLLHIKTYSQTFSNNPNEKFLLMILCSQAKLENDNKSINVMRGMKTKLNMGWRPGVAPLGYMNRAFGGVKDIIIDPERAPIIKQIFDKTAQGTTGREMHTWLKEINFTNRSGKHVSLSQIYLILNNPFYYGEFEWPEGSGNWYKGAHEPIITKALYTQIHVGRVDYKGVKGKKHFPFKQILECGRCGSAITAEEKFKLLKDGSHRRHVYYSCAKGKDRSCTQPYINEVDLTHQLLQYIRLEGRVEVSLDLKRSAMEYRDIVSHLVDKYSIEEDTSDPLAIYTEYVLNSDNAQLISRFVSGISQKFQLDNKKISTNA